jgi:hypothetical protein
MNDSRILIKDSELKKNIPASLFHRLTPILFADQGQIPSSKGKKKKCYIVVTLAGIYFFRPQKLASQFKLGEFISTYSITEIAWQDARRRDLATKTKNIYFICNHADDAVGFIVSARNALFVRCSDPTPIRLRNFPAQPVSSSLNVYVSDDTISQVRYVCCCLRCGVPTSEKLLDFFHRLDPETNRTLFLDESLDSPAHLSCLTTPVNALGKLTTIHFKSYAPFAVCRLAHHLMKKSATVRTIIFENYTHMVPAQLRMDKLCLQPTEPLSFTFLKLGIPESDFLSLVDELAKYDGEFQRLTIIGVQLTGPMAKSIFRAVTQVRCFRGLEVLEFDRVDLKGIPSERMVKNITRLAKHSRFLNRLSLAHWSVPVSPPMPMFMTSFSLQELVLSKQDLSQALPEFEVPSNLRLMNFSFCHFTVASIQSLFTILSRCRTSISLILQDLTIPEAHWMQLFDAFKQLPKLTCIQELDWSGNRLPSAVIPQFVQYFFGTNDIKFLAVDRVFRTSLIGDLQRLLQGLPIAKMWGLSLGGGVESNFSGNFKLFTQVLDAAEGIVILHIDGQKMTDGDSQLFLEFLERQRNISEISCDDSNLSSEQLFLDFYRRLDVLEISAVGRPLIDVPKLYSRSQTLSREFQTFRTAIQQRHRSTTGLIRAYYMSHCDPQQDKRTSVRQMHEFSDKFPKCFWNWEVPDYFAINQKFGTKEYPSLCLLDDQESFVSLADLHGGIVSDPVRSPQYPLNLSQDEIDMLRGKLPETLFSLFDAAESFEELDVPELYLPPLWETDEMQRTIKDLAGVWQEPEMEAAERVTVPEPVWTPDQPPMLPPARKAPGDDQDKIARIQKQLEMPQVQPLGDVSELFSVDGFRPQEFKFLSPIRKKLPPRVEPIKPPRIEIIRPPSAVTAKEPTLPGPPTVERATSAGLFRPAAAAPARPTLKTAGLTFTAAKPTLGLAAQRPRLLSSVPPV